MGISTPRNAYLVCFKFIIPMRYVRFIVFCYLGYFGFNLQYYSKIKSFEKTRTSKKLEVRVFFVDSAKSCHLSGLHSSRKLSSVEYAKIPAMFFISGRRFSVRSASSRSFFYLLLSILISTKSSGIFVVKSLYGRKTKRIIRKLRKINKRM